MHINRLIVIVLFTGLGLLTALGLRRPSEASRAPEVARLAPEGVWSITSIRAGLVFRLRRGAGPGGPSDRAILRVDGRLVP